MYANSAMNWRRIDLGPIFLSALLFSACLGIDGIFIWILGPYLSPIPLFQIGSLLVLDLLLACLFYLVMKRAEERSQADEAFQRVNDRLELRVRSRTEELTRTQGTLEAAVADLQQVQVAERLRSRELKTMLDIAQILSQPGDFEQKCGLALGELAQVIQSDLVTLRVLDEKEEALILVAASGPASRSRPPSAVLPRSNSLSGAALEQGQPLITNDYPSHPLARSNSVASGVKSLVSLPIYIGGRALGTVNLTSTEPDHFTPESVGFLATIVQELGLLLENSRLNQNLRTNTEEMALVDEITRIVTSTLEIDQVYEKFGAELKKLVEFQRMAISLIDHEAGTYTLKYVVGVDIPGRNIGQVRALAGGSMQQVVATGQTSIREDIADAPMFPSDQAILSAGLRSNVRVPLISKGRLVGTLSLRNHRVRTYGIREQTILERLASQIAPAIENAQLYEKTREDEEQLRKLSQAVEQNPSAVMITNAQGNIEYVNLKFTHITGYAPDEVIGQTPRILKSDQTSIEEHQELWRAITTGGEWHGERLNRKKDGELYWSSQSISPIRDGKREITHFVAVIEDITQRKELEAAERLRTQELEALVNIAEILVRPESFEERCGAIMEELVRIGEAERATIRVPSEDGLRLISVAGPATAELPPTPVLTDRETLAHKAFQEGRAIFVNDYGSHPLASPNFLARGVKAMASLPIKFGGHTVGLVNVLSKEKDHFTPTRVNLLTAIVDGLGALLNNLRLDEELNLMERQYLQSQKMESIGRLAGGVAHDFNNLLTAIQGYSQLALLETPPNGITSHHLQEIQKATERAAHLTNQLLAFSRNQVIEPKVVNLNDLILNLDNMLYRLLGGDIELVILPEPDLKSVKVDPGQIEQVLMNLAVNAQDAMPQGGKLTIETANVSTHLEGSSLPGGNDPVQQVLMKVSDTGCGMSEEVLARIFEPFFTTKEVGKGTGLGLATSYGIVQQSGGHIEVQSRLGQGTTFEIYLPSTRAPVYEEPEKVGEPGEAPSPLPIQGRETVLLVEDEPLVRDMVSLMLREQGYQVLEANNGKEALRLLSNRSGKEPGLMLTDVVMPQMGGIELAERVRATIPDMKILFTSGYLDGSQDQEKMTGPGMDFMPKPFSIESIGAKVRQLLA